MREFLNITRLFEHNKHVVVVTSPFRRAMQTGRIGFGKAFVEEGLLGSRCGGRADWIASDDLSETAYNESACRRHSKQVISQWHPCLSVETLAEHSFNLETNAAQELWRDLNKPPNSVERSEIEQLTHRRASRAVDWLAGRPENIIWVVTHKGPLHSLLKELLGARAATEYPKDSLVNGRVIALRLHVAGS